jgi:glucan 1,3-beta-glucosidase
MFAGRRLKSVAEELEFQRRLDDLRAELAADNAEATSLVPPEQNGWRGVNLGGWLLWEHGPCNSAAVVKAAGDRAPMDEWTLSEQLRQKHGDTEAARLMREHRQTFITKRDFQQISSLGLNAVRIPFSYWLFEGPRPGEPFLGPDVDILDNAFQWAAECGLQVVLSYHGTVGFQSDHQASGRFDEKWTPELWDTQASLDVLHRVALRYRHNSALGGITVVNEPSGEIPLEQLRQYYKDAYWAIRRAGVPYHVQVIMPLYHRHVSEMSGHFPKSEGYQNIVFDEHVYQVFGDDWYRMSLADHLRHAAAKVRSHDVRTTAKFGEKIIVSEWSLALPTRDFSKMIAWEWHYLTQAEQNAVIRSFASRQLKTFSAFSSGWFFWSWRDEDSIQWSFLDAITKRLFPSSTPLPNASLSLLPPPAAAAQWYRTGDNEEVGTKDMRSAFKAAALAAQAPEERWRRCQQKLPKGT